MTTSCSRTNCEGLLEPLRPGLNINGLLTGGCILRLGNDESAALRRRVPPETRAGALFYRIAEKAGTATCEEPTKLFAWSTLAAFNICVWQL
mmetsp:Transcript_6066/g.10449  ORF Transcript_6066/g.10449 Transcript_6066/m.10449 type:complete len:92 (+) Transcript_6066:526-801(+)